MFVCTIILYVNRALRAFDTHVHDIAQCRMERLATESQLRVPTTSYASHQTQVVHPIVHIVPF